MKKLSSLSDKTLLSMANLFRDTCSNIPVCRVVKKNKESYNYIPLPITDGPMKDTELDAIGMVTGKALMNEDIDLLNITGITESDRGGGFILSSGINIHWANWYDSSTINAFKGDFLTAEMSPEFIMGSSLRPGLYLPEHIKKSLQKGGVVLIDDVVSTSKTLFTLKSILDMADIPLRAIVCGVEKVDYEGGSKLRETFPHIPFITVARVKIRDFTEEEELYYSFNKNFIGMSEVIGDRTVPYYIL